MLNYLSIKGLAVIEELTIDFGQHFNVITGETGAGKSILIKALSLLLGGKAGPEAVRKGVDSATIAGGFTIGPEHSAVTILQRLGVPLESDGDGIEVLVRRQIHVRGRSQAWINDEPVTVAALRELGEVLIDIFGQHDNHRLLDPSRHVHYLDQFLNRPEFSREVAHSYRLLMEQVKATRSLLDHYAARSRDRDYLSYRCQELGDFAPETTEYQSLEQLVQEFEIRQRAQQRLGKVGELLDESAQGESLSKPLWEAVRLLERLADEDTGLKGHVVQATALAEGLDDLSYAVGKLLADESQEAQGIEQAQERLSCYQELMRKLHVASVDELVREGERLAQDLASLETAEEDLRKSLVKALELARALKENAKGLTKARQQAAKRVKKVMETELQLLAMPGACVEVAFAPIERMVADLELMGFAPELSELWLAIAEVISEVSEFGAEKVQFNLAANQGEPAHALHKIASGGEVSRIMLAIKRALAAGAETCVLVFDEIDSGISGKVADVVGQKIRELGRRFQVICISHLAQVAVFADEHFLVRKKLVQGRTESEIVRLSASESAQEVARLLSGVEVTNQSLANAKALLQRAKTLSN